MPTTAHDIKAVHLADVGLECDRLVESIRSAARRFRRTGAIIALSGGIDSSVCLGLAARALGTNRVVGLTLPDKESSNATAGLAAEVAATFGVRLEQRDITAVLDALGCYEDRLQVVQRVYPAFDPAADAYSVEFVPSSSDSGDELPSFVLNVVHDGVRAHHRLGGRDFLTIMAATNQKQRVRMLMTYRIADERNLIVVGTSNRLELDQGFYVKHGDGCGETFPLRKLLKSQVYDLAEYLDVPESVRGRAPTTDTFSAPQSQEEYFYGTSVELGDQLWLAWHDGADVDTVASALSLPAAQVKMFFDLYQRRSSYADYLRETL
jgi:NAD+ synthase